MVETVERPILKLNDSDCWELPAARYLNVKASFSLELIGFLPRIGMHCPVSLPVGSSSLFINE